MSVAQSILDAEARQDAVTAAVSAKVDQRLAAQIDGMTAQEQADLAARLDACAAALDAVAAKS